MISRKDGGRDDDINLITSCFGCNRGKSSKSVKISALKGNAIKQEERALKDKIQQLRAYYQYLEKKEELNEMMVDQLAKRWEQLSDGHWRIEDRWRNSLRHLVAKHSIESINEAMVISWSKSYVNYGGKFHYMCGVLKHMKNDIDKRNEMAAEDLPF